MKKTFIVFCVITLFVQRSFAQTDVINVTSGGPLGSGSWLRFLSGGNDHTSIQESWGLNIGGSDNQPVKIFNTSLLVGYTSSNQSFGVGNAYISGNLGIGTLSPQSLVELRKDNSGAQGPVLELNNEAGGNGASSEIFFTTYSRSGNNPSARIKVADNGNFSGNISFDTKGSTLTAPLYTRMYIQGATGNIGIGTSNPDQTLTVKGNIHAQQVVVDLNFPAGDYVFDLAYQLPDLASLKRYLEKNHHLPEMPSASEMNAKGMNLGDMNELLLKKVEELTLYLIDKDRQLKQVEEDKKQQRITNKQQQDQIDELKKLLVQLLKRKNINANDR